MKNVLKAFGIIAFVAIIGFTMACGGGDDGTGGTSGTGGGSSGGGGTSGGGGGTGGTGSGTGNGGGSGSNLNLSGTITISPNSGIIAGFTQLNAIYNGTEPVKYQWNRDGTATIGEGNPFTGEFTPTQGGSYTVTVSATGYNDKTSAAVTVNAWTSVSTRTLFDYVHDNEEIFDSINAIAFGNGKFVAGTATHFGTWGCFSKMAISTDGITWTVVDTGTLFDYVDNYVDNGKTTCSSINAIAYGNGKFVACGNRGKMAYSTDGTTWTAIDTPLFDYGYLVIPFQDIKAIAYGNGKFVAGDYSGQKAISTDGITWTAVDVGKTYDGNPINAIVYGNGKFVAVSGIRYAKIIFSDDGVTWNTWSERYMDLDWKEIIFKADEINAIAYGNDKFVAGGNEGEMAYSTDGTTWTAVKESGFGRSRITVIAYGNNMFVAGGESYPRMAYSTDSITWIPIKSYIPLSGGINAIAYGNNMFVAGGDWANRQLLTSRMAYLSVK
jgi:hypothetical protein